MSKTIENTLENKAKFFALYVLQGVFVNGLGAKGWLTTVDLNSIANGNIGGHLELKPLSSISDEEAIFAFDLDKNNQPRITKIYSTYNEYLHIEYEFMGSEGVFLDNGIVVSPNSLGLDAIMKLTKLGYHVGTTREVEYGWVKLKED